MLYENLHILMPIYVANFTSECLVVHVGDGDCKDKWVLTQRSLGTTGGPCSFNWLHIVWLLEGLLGFSLIELITIS